MNTYYLSKLKLKNWISFDEFKLLCDKISQIEGYKLELIEKINSETYYFSINELFHYEKLNSEFKIQVSIYFSKLNEKEALLMINTKGIGLIFRKNKGKIYIDHEIGPLISKILLEDSRKYIILEFPENMMKIDSWGGDLHYLECNIENHGKLVLHNNFDFNYLKSQFPDLWKDLLQSYISKLKIKIKDKEMNLRLVEINEKAIIRSSAKPIFLINFLKKFISRSKEVN